MPCMSYDDDPSYNVRQWKNKTDMLARIACKALAELEKHGQASELLKADTEVREWWWAHKVADAKAREKALLDQERERVKTEALAKLSMVERRVLGLK